MEITSFSFKKGWGQVQQKDSKEVRERIEKCLGIRNRNSFYNRLNGDIEPKVSEAKSIEVIFADYGITEVWGE